MRARDYASTNLHFGTLPRNRRAIYTCIAIIIRSAKDGIVVRTAISGYNAAMRAPAKFQQAPIIFEDNLRLCSVPLDGLQSGGFLIIGVTLNPSRRTI